MITDANVSTEKNAADILRKEISARLSYFLPLKSESEVGESELYENNIIFVGNIDGTLIKKCAHLINVPNQNEGYSIYVGESIFSKENQMVIIGAKDSAGLLYGCMDFCNKYLGYIIYNGKNMWTDKTYINTFEQPLPTWSVSSAPSIKRRALWTWGHVIYDYKNFFKNMAKLRLNEIIIWNDVAPINAKEVVEYAHQYNIKVIWGFAWGWDTKSNNVLAVYDQNMLKELKKKVIDTYENQYAKTGGDGIYFQSFTELTEEVVDGKCVAELVSELVNDIAGSLLSAYPDLHIQFGLHATSVKNKLDYIKKVDERIYIVWEDCGSFPYSYISSAVSGFDETLEFTKSTLKLRGEKEKWGAVFKGTLNLDWLTFEHISSPFVLGEKSEEFIKQRSIIKNKIWKLQQAGWIKNADYLRKTVEEIKNNGNDTVIEALVEDALFENEIFFPVALFAEMLWDSSAGTQTIIERVSKYPCVNFANI
jgi:hypothetical protein